MLMTLDLPSGVRDHGTDIESRGRWLDSNFVRWKSGSLRPIGGWEVRKATASTYAPRGSVAWKDNSGDSRIAFGSFEKLYVMTDNNNVSDITPVGFTTGSEDAAEIVGYGIGNYGEYTYGTPRESTGVFAECTTWSMDTWGEYLIACSNDDGKIYEWTLTGVATAVTNAPTGNKAAIVTDERFLLALASGGDPKKIAWCDREDRTTWTPDATNEAGSFILQTSGQIMSGIKVKGQTLILTTTDAFTARYIGAPFVFGFDRVGDACGVISRRAATAIREGAIWMGNNNFYIYDGSSVRELPCDVHDHVFTDINKQQKSKVFAVHNSQHNEAWFFYPSDAGAENSKYVVYNYAENWWSVGSIDRTTGVDNGIFDRPLWMDSSGNVYNQETGFIYDGTSPYCESAPIYIADGTNVMKINDLLPDENTQGEVTMTFKTRFYPNGTEYSYGPYTLGNPTSVRFTGRQTRLRVDGSASSDWRVGKPRINVIQGGRR